MLPASRALLSGTRAARPFSTSARRFADVTPLPPRRPVGAFRGGLFGFLLGTALSGTAVYSYFVGEYKTSNDLLTEDIYSLQTSVARLSSYVQNLEQRLQAGKK